MVEFVASKLLKQSEIFWINLPIFCLVRMCFGLSQIPRSNILSFYAHRISWLIFVIKMLNRVKPKTDPILHLTGIETIDNQRSLETCRSFSGFGLIISEIGRRRLCKISHNLIFYIPPHIGDLSKKRMIKKIKSCCKTIIINIVN